jgi:hypothetical protein
VSESESEREREIGMIEKDKFLFFVTVSHPADVQTERKVIFFA